MQCASKGAQIIKTDLYQVIKSRRLEVMVNISGFDLELPYLIANIYRGSALLPCIFQININYLAF